LALLLTNWEATTFLIGEYSEPELRDNPVYTVADGLFLLFSKWTGTPLCSSCSS